MQGCPFALLIAGKLVLLNLQFACEVLPVRSCLPVFPVFQGCLFACPQDRRPICIVCLLSLSPPRAQVLIDIRIRNNSLVGVAGPVCLVPVFLQLQFDSRLSKDLLSSFKVGLTTTTTTRL